MKLKKHSDTEINNQTLPYVGGLEIIASTLNGTLVTGSGSVHAGSKENMMSLIWRRWFGISERSDGKNPLFFTISAQSIQITIN